MPTPPPRPHFVLVPLFAQGHFIPMLDMARLLADRNVLVSLILTPLNAARIQPIITAAKSSNLPICFVELEFPCGDPTGLPLGCESFELVPPKEILRKQFFVAMSLLEPQLARYLRSTDPAPTRIISDNCNFWTVDIALELNIPRFIFHGLSCFFLLCDANIRRHNAFAEASDEHDAVVVPGLGVHHKITIAPAQASGWFTWPGWEDILEKYLHAEGTADGVVANTFYELEPEFVSLYQNMISKHVWPIGPLSLCNRDDTSKFARGKKASIDEHELIRWLDGNDKGSVIYVCFGSFVKNSAAHMVEIARGLERAKVPFLWVVKEGEEVPEGVEGGMVVRGWAPQVAILSHPAAGGFLTHCGWNSVLEAVTAGVAMVTWPSFADQFLNERLVVDVLGTGVSLGVKKPSYFVEEGEVAVRREEVERAVREVMEGGERKERAREFGERARKAMEVGGSSYQNLTEFIEYAKEN